MLKRNEEDHKPENLPGQYFVYVTWFITIILPALKFNDWLVQRILANLYWFALGVTEVYAGSEIFKSQLKK